MYEPGTVAIRHMTVLLRRLVLASACLLMSACFSDREGELVTHWIACQKSEAGKWVSADRSFSNRFNIVHESRYQVSFASQRVISSTGLEFKKCAVYDRRNWTCNDSDSSLFVVKDGGRPLSCSKPSGLCFLEVRLISRAVIIFRGVDEAERLCNIYSEAFETFRKIQLGHLTSQWTRRLATPAAGHRGRSAYNKER